MSEHAILAPSSAHQWVKCAGVVGLSQSIPQEDTDATRDGTAAHWIAEQILISYTQQHESIRLSQDFVDKQAPNGVVMTEEMYDAAYTYASEILGFCQDRGALGELEIEQRVDCSMIHEQCWGTPDCWAYDSTCDVLNIWDFKFGHGRVTAYENWQMICYALGILHAKFGANPLQESGPLVRIHIIQPRCYDGLGPVQQWDVRAVDMRGHLNILREAASKAMAAVNNCSTGDHCKYCEAASICPALLESTARIIDSVQMAMPTIATDAGLGYELDKIRAAELLLEQRKSSLEAEVTHRITNGTHIPGYKLEQGYGNRKWLESKETIVSTGKLLGVDLLDEPKLLPPAKADQLLKVNKVDPAVISSYYGKSPTAMKLKTDDGSKARQIFSNRSI